MSKQKGFAVISGSSSVVAKIMENGEVAFGVNKPVNMRISGALTVDLPGAGSGSVSGRVFQVSDQGVVTVDKLTAANVLTSDGSTDVQTVLDQLSGAGEVDERLDSLESADTALSGEISTEKARAELEEENLASLISAEAARAGDAEEALGSLISAEAVRAGDAEEDLASLISAEAVRAGDAEENLASIISAEASTLSSDITDAISTAQQYTDGVISTLVGVAPSTLDTIYELAEALNNDESILVTLAGQTSTAVSVEASRAMLAEEALGSLISAEVVRAGDAEEDLASLISAEAVRAGDAEEDLASSISAEVVRAGDAEEDLASLISAEVVRAGDAEEDLASLISAETVRAGDAEEDLASLISAEATRAGDAEEDLASLISAETVRAGDAEEALSDRVSTLELIDVAGTANEVTVSENNGTFTVGLASDVTVQNSLTVNGSGSFKAVSNILDATVDSSTLSTMAAAPASHNGKFFYLTATNHAAAQAVGFDQANKWYFCEGDEWFASPFFGE